MVAAAGFALATLRCQVAAREHAGRVGWAHEPLPVSVPVLVSPTLWDTHTHTHTQNDASRSLVTHRNTGTADE